MQLPDALENLKHRLADLPNSDVKAFQTLSSFDAIDTDFVATYPTFCRWLKAVMANQVDTRKGICGPVNDSTLALSTWGTEALSAGRNALKVLPRLYPSFTTAPHRFVDAIGEVIAARLAGQSL